MADPRANPAPNGDTGDDAGAEPGRGPAPGTPLWVYAFAIIAIGLVLLFVVLHLTGGGLGPGTHAPSGGLGGR